MKSMQVSQTRQAAIIAGGQVVGWVDDDTESEAMCVVVIT
jgi:hypothetical protein